MLLRVGRYIDDFNPFSRPLVTHHGLLLTTRPFHDPFSAQVTLSRMERSELGPKISKQSRSSRKLKQIKEIGFTPIL